jgi:hypothetical protein
VTAIFGVVVTVVVQLALALTGLPVQASAPLAVTVSVNGPQLTGTVIVPVYGALAPTAKVGTVSKVVPSLSFTTTLFSGTSPVLDTVPLTWTVVVPYSMVWSQLLVTAMFGLVVTVVVQLAFALTGLPVQASDPLAVTVSVNGPQLTGTVIVPL